MGLSANRSSFNVSLIINISFSTNACPQKEIALSPSVFDSPWQDLNHSRFASINVNVEMGTWKILVAQLVSRSNRSSGGVSSKSNAYKDAILFSSSLGMG